MLTRYSMHDTSKIATRRPLYVAGRPDSTHCRAGRPARSKGISLVETITAMAAAFIVMLASALLVHSGYKGWQRTFDNANSESRIGALDAMIALGSVGRKSNKMDYNVYKVDGSYFEKALPLVNPEEVVTGQAVEFRYWDTDLDSDLMEPDVTGTVYALFYLAGDELRVDYGPYPPGGIDGSGNRIVGDEVITIKLAENVTSAEFSHTTRNMAGEGKGCVRMKLVVTDPKDGSSKTTIAATLMRNVWPQ